MRALLLASAVALVNVLLVSGCDLLVGADECSSDSDCSGDDLCDNGDCVECEDDGDCDDDEECDSGECERVNNGNEGEGEAGEGEGEGGEGEGEGEGGEGEGESGLGGIGQACDGGGFNDSGDCENNLVCVPLQTNSSTGVCRLKCGEFDSASPDSVTSASPDGTTCPGSTSCQVITTLPDAALAAIACVTRPTQRDDICVSVFDEFFDPFGFPSAACPNGMDCQLTATSTDDFSGETTFDSFSCKEPCDLTAGNSCGFGEECLPRPLNFPPDLELDIDGAELTCSDGAGAANAACTSGDDIGCPCSLADGFKCQVFNLNDGGQEFFCNRDGGNCGEPVPPFLVENEPDLGTDTSLLCNEVEESRYCDPSVFDGAANLANVGSAICVGVSSTTNDGICLAFCGNPAFDENNDGLLGDPDDGAGERFDCGTAQVCTSELGLLIGLVVDLGRTCSTSICLNGRPCPEECGPGDAFCSPEGTCVAPFFTCEPAPAGG